MKKHRLKILVGLLAFSVFWLSTMFVDSAYRFNPFTKKLDYYEADTTAGGAALGWSYSSDSTLLTRSTTTDQTLIGGSSTTSATAIFEVIGESVLDHTTLEFTTTTGFFSSASSTVHADFRVDGNATTTGSLSIGGDLSVTGDMGILDADVPDTITASNYLLLTGGSLTGDLDLSSSWLSQATSTLDYWLNASTTRPTSADVTADIATHAGDDNAHHELVTITGEDYASLSTQEITFANIDANNMDLTDAFSWSGIHAFSSDLRSTGILHASTTDFDLLTVSGNTSLQAGTSTNWAITSLGGGGGDLKVAADGSIYEGTDATGSGASDWLTDATENFLYPSTTKGIIISASSTIAGDLSISDNLLVTATTTLNDDLEVDSRIIKVGPTTNRHYVPSGGDNSAFMVIDKNNTASDASLLLADQGDLKWELGMAGDNNLYWKTVTGSEGSYAFTNVFKMDYTSLRVGIGTEAPGAKLEIASTSPTARVELIVNNKSTSGTDGSCLRLSAENDGDAWYVCSDAGLNGGDNFFINDGTFGQGLFIDADGHVGIEDTSLTYGFEIGTTSYQTGNATNTGAFSIGELSVNNAYWFPTVAGDASQVLKTDANGIVTWQADATGSGASDWLSSPDELYLYPSTTRGILATASSSISGDFRIDGSATTTGSFYVGGTVSTSALFLGDLATVAGSFLAIDAEGLVIATTSPAAGSGITNLNAETLGSIGDVSTTTIGYGSTLTWDTSNWVSTSTIYGFTEAWNTLYNATTTLSGFTPHNAVTLAGQNYLTISTQEITANEIEPDDLAASDFGNFNCDGDTCTIDDLFLKNTAADTTAFGLTMGSGTTTDSMYVGGLLDVTGDADFTTYASSTTALNTQGTLHVGGNGTIDGTLGVTGAISEGGTVLSDLYVQASDWTTIDNYPSACTNQAVTGIGDTLTCTTLDSNYLDMTAAYSWSGINTFSSDLRSTGTLHATSTDFDNLNVYGNGTTTGAFSIANLSVNNVYWFPVVAGGANEILKTDANGILGWQADAGGVSDWLSSADELFLYPSTTRGIHATASSSIDGTFRVQGNATTTGDFVVGLDTNTATTTIQIGNIGQDGDGKGAACLKMRDVDGGGWSYGTVLDGAITWSTNSCE